MSTEQLSRLLSYPDDAVRAPDVRAIVEVATRRRRRRRAASLTSAALVPLAAVTVVALTGTPQTDRTVTPAGVGGTATGQQTVAPATEQSPTSDLRRAAPGERVDMGHGWTVWLRGTAVCRSMTELGAPGDRFLPFGCRSTTDGNIGGINLQSAGGPEGAMYTGVLPWDTARVDIVLGGQRHTADLVQFEELPGWTVYYLWADGSHANPGVFAYDAKGNRLGD